MLYKRDFYTLILEKVPTVGGGIPLPHPRRGPPTNVPPSRFCPSKTQSVPARLVVNTQDILNISHSKKYPMKLWRKTYSIFMTNSVA